MAKVELFSSGASDEIYNFKCPACGEIHQFWTIKNGKPWWDFNGDVENPTVSPSIATTMWNKGFCHCFIKNGEIQYLNDCTHHLAGQTVKMENI